VTRPRLLVVGLDCAPPSLVFDRYRSAMPTIARAMGRGIWGPLRSTVPPITVPAWAAMTSGRDPGELGLYGFRNRASRAYAMTTSTCDDVHVERLWDLVERAGKRAAALYVPPTWPPPTTTATLVSCMLTPGPDAPHTQPPELAEELRVRFGPHMPDLDDDGALDGDAVLAGLHTMATQHFDVAEHVIATRDPDFTMLVELGTDRLHHALWPAMDPSDPRHDPASPFGRGARDFYRYLDARIGRLLEKCGPETTLLVVSDHGARPLLGGVRVNELLRRAGWLVSKREPDTERAFDLADVDWPRTRAWSEGGYYARVFLNVIGREPDGALPPEGVAEAKRELEALLSRIEEDGVVIESRVVRPEDAYREVNGVAPDLLCFFGDLTHRSIGGVGAAKVIATIEEVERDRGRGGANHDWDGVFVLAGPAIDPVGRVEGASILDVAPTCLRLLGLEVPAAIRGRDLRALAAET
jgi:predicted AlkP superfamily phosphohydrolase/phosphomutase